MKLSTKGRYAVTAMIDLALHQNQRLVSLSEIAQAQDISLSYLEQLFSKLRRYEIVKGVRGPGGGYCLARNPEDITIADIVNAVDEKLDATRCEGHGNCQGGRKCLSHAIWYDLSKRIYGFLHEITLADAIASTEIQRVSSDQDSLMRAKTVRLNAKR